MTISDSSKDNAYLVEGRRAGFGVLRIFRVVGNFKWQ
jgi:hypothetical protein